MALGVALFFGAAKALKPRHGKTLVAAYMVGSRGTVKHGVLLGLTVTISHTATVVLMGLVALFAEQYVMPEQLFPYLSTCSGLLIVSIGLWMVRARWRQREVPLRRRAISSPAVGATALAAANPEPIVSYEEEQRDDAQAGVGGLGEEAGEC